MTLIDRIKGVLNLYDLDPIPQAQVLSQDTEIDWAIWLAETNKMQWPTTEPMELQLEPKPIDVKGRWK
jgi:hypothetical protein